VLGPGKFYWMRFRSEPQRDAFERGIAQLYATGEIDRILAPQKCKSIKWN